jgi:hypothetical protein
VLRIAEGKVVERWEMMQQVGVVPKPRQAVEN